MVVENILQLVLLKDQDNHVSTQNVQFYLEIYPDQMSLEFTISTFPVDDLHTKLLSVRTYYVFILENILFISKRDWINKRLYFTKDLIFIPERNQQIIFISYTEL